MENTVEVGVCPVCKVEGNLFYYKGVPDGGTLCYPWRCEKCGAEGKECYDITFTGHTDIVDKDGNKYYDKRRR